MAEANLVRAIGCLKDYEGLRGDGAYHLPVTVEVPVMQDKVERFMQYAEAHPEMAFRVEHEGFSEAGWSPVGLAKAGCFSMVPPNVILCPELAPYVKGIRGPYSRPTGR